MRRFFIHPKDIEGNRAILQGDDAKHIIKVLRLKSGDGIELLDGKGGRITAVIEKLTKGQVHVSLGEKIATESESPLSITLAQGYVKDRKMDRLVRQLTELGINTWLPFFATRSIPRPAPEKLAARKKRWEKIAREAVKQCNRNRLPEIADPVPFESIIDNAATYDLKLFFWECSDVLLENNELWDTAAPPRSALVVVGPEGGLTDQEAEAAKTAGFHTATLGPRILRAETAAVAACTIVQYLFGDLAGKKP